MNDVVLANPPIVVTGGTVRRPFLETWLEGQTSPKTRRAYDGHIRDFAGFVHATPTFAVQALIELEHGEANRLASAYRANLVERGMAPNTINVRLTALRKLTQDARKFGLTDWSLDVENVRARNYRDTRGPGQLAFKEMLAELGKRPDDPKRRRDTAILWLMFGLALRRNEVVSLDLDSIDFRNGRLRIVGKGHRDAEWLTMPRTIIATLTEWVDARGGEPGPLFVNLDAASGRGRLSGSAVWKIVVGLGRAIGVNPASGRNAARPHGLRHLGVSVACERSGHDLTAVKAFSRHAKLDTVQLYVDNLKDKQGAVADLVVAD